ncbi:MAG: phasin family protein [Pseudomonadota bacterium]
MNNMNEQFARQAQEMFNMGKNVQIPENMQQLAEDSVQKTRESYQRFNDAAKDSVKVFEEMMLASHAGVKAISEKMIHNSSVNTEAAFDAATAIARAKSVPEAARLQADFMQQQAAVASAQAKELFELSAKVTQQTFESINQATTKSFEQFKKS